MLEVIGVLLCPVIAIVAFAGYLVYFIRQVRDALVDEVRFAVWEAKHSDDQSETDLYVS